jgi:hypothetical protein
VRILRAGERWQRTISPTGRHCQSPGMDAGRQSLCCQVSTIGAKSKPETMYADAVSNVHADKLAPRVRQLSLVEGSGNKGTARSHSLDCSTRLTVDRRDTNRPHRSAPRFDLGACHDTEWDGKCFQQVILGDSKEF